MRRRKFVKAIAGLGAISAAAKLNPPPAFAIKKKQRWRMAMAVPKTFPVWGEGMQRFAKNVETLSGGNIKIKVYGAGELVPAFGILDAVKKGELQIGHSAAYYHQGKIPESPFFASVPYGMTSDGMIGWILHGGGQELWDELMAPHQVKCLPCGGVGYQMTGWFNKQINTIDDLKGLKIRIPGLPAKVYERAGAKPILLPGGELFTALSTGVIDAVEWTDPYCDYLMGLHKAAKYYYGSSWHEPGSLLELMINKKTWDSLDPALQQTISIAANETTVWMISKWNSMKGEYLQKLRTEGKVEVKAFPLGIQKHFRGIAEEIKRELSAASPLAKRIYKSFSSYQKSFESYQDLAERTYLRAVRSSMAECKE